MVISDHSGLLGSDPGTAVETRRPAAPPADTIEPSLGCHVTAAATRSEVELPCPTSW